MRVKTHQHLHFIKKNIIISSCLELIKSLFFIKQIQIVITIFEQLFQYFNNNLQFVLRDILLGSQYFNLDIIFKLKCN